jgi:transcriptional regulator with XRE-family HTH domain
MEKSLYNKKYKLFISLLREYRRKKDITQAELAKALGTEQAVISKFEKCERRVDFLEFINMCEALDVSTIEFMTEFENRLKKK